MIFSIETWRHSDHASMVFDRNGVWEGDDLDLYYPIFMTVKFLFYFGWLRVAETLYNPLGEDDEDFELNDILNRHIRVSFTIVDQTDKLPPLKKDAFWDKMEPELLDGEDQRVTDQNSLL